mmetsp:Transcript_65877/g.208492  ORF Transcript_65877/g.208492 Transcript_65877/m.208492 type:complete len:297 (-) Transcript_65877:237-1127(-)
MAARGDPFRSGSSPAFPHKPIQRKNHPLVTLLLGRRLDLEHVLRLSRQSTEVGSCGRWSVRSAGRPRTPHHRPLPPWHGRCAPPVHRHGWCQIREDPTLRSHLVSRIHRLGLGHHALGPDAQFAGTAARSRRAPLYLSLRRSPPFAGQARQRVSPSCFQELPPQAREPRHYQGAHGPHDHLHDGEEEGDGQGGRRRLDPGEHRHGGPGGAQPPPRPQCRPRDPRDPGQHGLGGAVVRCYGRGHAPHRAPRLRDRRHQAQAGGAGLLAVRGGEGAQVVRGIPRVLRRPGGGEEARGL